MSDTCTTNALFVIRPYRLQGLWAFDDARVGLVAEPFVSGMSEMLDVMVGDVGVDKVTLIFAATPFPGHQAELIWLREDSGGNWYRWTTRAMDGWLCPALSHYFQHAPAKLYCQVVLPGCPTQ